MQFLVARAPALDDALFARFEELRRAARSASAIVEGAADDVLAAADVVVTASGTATVQTALHGRPMVIVYRLSPLTYAIGRRFVRVPAYGMVNLVAGRQIVPELIQQNFTPENVARETVSLLDRCRARRARSRGPRRRAARARRNRARRCASRAWCSTSPNERIVLQRRDRLTAMSATGACWPSLTATVCSRHALRQRHRARSLSGNSSPAPP